MLESTRCVVLNTTYEPLSVISAKRGLRLVIEGRAFLTEAHPNGFVRTATKKFPLPTQIRMKEMIKSHPASRVPAQLTQRNLFLRDRYTCQYCGRMRKHLESGEYLTRDHIVPETRGGKDSWTNVVTACRKCNNIKADHLLSEMEELYFKYEEQAKDAALHETRKSSKETAEWISSHLVDVKLKPRAPTILQLWAQTGTLRLPNNGD